MDHEAVKELPSSETVRNRRNHKNPMSVFDVSPGPEYEDIYEARHYNNTDPIRRLMLAVFMDAIVCFRRGYLDVGVSKAISLDAEEWFASDERMYIFDFQNVCDALDLSPSYIRKELQDWCDKIKRSTVVQATEKFRLRKVASSSLRRIM